MNRSMQRTRHACINEHGPIPTHPPLYLLALLHGRARPLQTPLEAPALHRLRHHLHKLGRELRAQPVAQRCCHCRRFFCPCGHGTAARAGRGDAR